MRRENVTVYFIIVLLLMGCSQITHHQKIYHVANDYYFSPHIMPGVKPDMLSPGFWVDLLQYPDEILLNDAEIDSLNSYIRSKKYVLDLTKIVDNDDVKLAYKINAINNIKRKMNYLKTAKLYKSDGEKLQEADFYSFLENFPQDSLDFDNLYIGKLALTTGFTNERMLPGDQFLSQKPFDDEFDFMQNNGLDMGEMTYALFRSRDHKWIFQTNRFSYGWVKKDNLFLLENLQTLDKFSEGIIQNAYTEYFENPDKTGFLGRIRMGSRIFVDTTYTDTAMCRILKPDYKSLGYAYINRDEIIIKPKKITSRNLIYDAFKWLNNPYGWGDTNQFVDCSKFIQNLYALYGILLPRNGLAQGNSWGNLYDPQVDSADIVISQNAIPGMTLIRFPGHIMLYIGQIEGKPYVIHSIYRYVQEDYGIVTSRVTNRVVVSDLSLMKGQERRTIFDRITQIVNPGRANRSLNKTKIEENHEKTN
ncbi:MAG: NlpC/P60 family protein [Candidatus Cloacimonetes bacterium]|nr:NlpC/P60 family protein [Candidatus Cloacimonadota bacterium]